MNLNVNRTIVGVVGMTLRRLSLQKTETQFDLCSFYQFVVNIVHSPLPSSPHHFEPRRTPCAIRCDTILHVQVHSRILSRTKPSTNLLVRFTSIHTKSEWRWRRRGRKSRSDHSQWQFKVIGAHFLVTMSLHIVESAAIYYSVVLFLPWFSSRLIWHKCKRIVVVAHIRRYSTAAFLRMQSKWKHRFLAEIVKSEIECAVHRTQNLVNDKRPKCTQSNNRKYIISRCFGQQQHDREQKIKKQKKNGKGRN